MRAHLERWLRRLGAAGVLGIGVVMACAGFWFSALAPLQQEVAARRLADERLRTRAHYQPVSAGSRAEQLRRFHALFPRSSELTGELERLHVMARTAGLELAQAEYRLERRPSGLWAYRVTLPVSGSYPQLRQLVGAVLKSMPTASIDALRFERKRAADTRLEAQLRLTLHLQGEVP